MNGRCCHEDYWPQTRTDPGYGECGLERAEYENDCEGCPER